MPFQFKTKTINEPAQHLDSAIPTSLEKDPSLSSESQASPASKVVNDRPIKEKQCNTKKTFALSEVDKKLIATTLRNPIQNIETLLEILNLGVEEPVAMTFLKRRLSLLDKEKYLGYNSHSGIVKITPKGKKQALLVLDSWSNIPTEEVVCFQEIPGREIVASLCAQLDVAFLKQGHQDTIEYLQYFSPCHIYGNNLDPIPHIKLQDSTVIHADCVMAFSIDKHVSLGLIFFIKNSSVSFLDEMVDKRLRQTVGKILSGKLSDETSKKMEAAIGHYDDFSILLIAPTSKRRDKVARVFHNDLPTDKVFLASMEELVGSPGFWGDVWYNCTSQKTGKLHEFWTK